MELRFKDLFKEKLRALGYQYHITEGGYVSADKATIIIDNRDPYKGQIKMYTRRADNHRKNIKTLLQFGAITLKTDPEYRETYERPPERRCFCGGAAFTARQICRHDVVVDGDNEFHSDIGIYDSETPYGPYVCKKCGAEFDELDDLRHVTGKERKTLCVNGELGIGDLVLSTGGDDCAYLVGIVKAIHHLGFPDHDTDNSEDDVLVDFTTHGYSGKRIAEIEAMFSKLHQESKNFEELSIDGVVMGPSMLIRITGIDETTLDMIVSSESEAIAYCAKYRGDNAIAKELVMALGVVPLEQGFSPAQILSLSAMLPATSFYMPIEFHQNNSSAYGFIKDAYYEEHDYKTEAFNGLILPLLENGLSGDEMYLLTPDNQRIYISHL
jgi:hypothetical protein